MGQSKSQTIPLLPLGDNAVLLPSNTLRVPVAGRSDIPALLTSIYTRAKSPKPDAASISIGCVPLRSPLLSRDGQNLIEDSEVQNRTDFEQGPIIPGDVDKSDLFAYGTVAKISGLQGRRTDDLALILEGTRRFKIDKVTQRKPFFEARVTFLDEPRKSRRMNQATTADTVSSRRYDRSRDPRVFRPAQAALA